MNDLRALQEVLKKAALAMPDKTLRIMAVEGKNAINKAFQDQGFNDGGKWKARATTDKRGRDITTYRTDRVGRAGSLNKYGRKNKGRAILTGHATGGDKLRNSFKSKTSLSALSVTFYTYKKYAARHNEGLSGMPKRQFLGSSNYLNNKIKTKVTKALDEIFN
jgi:phage gpG-like protein